MTPDPEKDPSAAGHDGASAPERDDGGEPADVETLRAKAAERDEYLDRLKRTMAEFQNYKHRVAREKSELRRFAVVDVVRAMLPALDNLERAVVSGGASDSDAVVSGVRMVVEQFHRVLDDLGVRPVEASNAKFDPAWMEAVARVETPDAPENTVIEVLETGYRIEDVVIRPARVVVAAAKAEG